MHMRSSEKMDSDMILFFIVPEYGCTTAEMTPELKNELSHRGKALRAMHRSSTGRESSERDRVL